MYNIITTATRLVIPPSFNGKRKKKHGKNWYDRNCLLLRNELNLLSRRLSKGPFNSYLGKAFILCRNNFLNPKKENTLRNRSCS